MLKVFATGLIAAMVAVAGVQTAKAEPSAYKVGMMRRDFVPPEPYDWRGDPKHALVTAIWYPADPGAQEKPLPLGPPGSSVFRRRSRRKKRGAGARNHQVSSDRVVARD
jgi:hypothetical protein